MALLIALTGSSGAGKTTAVDYLEKIGVGQKVYLGQSVLDEINAQGLPAGPDSERRIRMEFRQRYGPGALSVLAGPQVEALLARNTNVLIDAVFEEAEHAHFQKMRARYCLLAIEANFEIRSRRLLARAVRPCSREELAARDEFERERLGTQAAMARASEKIINESSMDAFEDELVAFGRALGLSPL
jgi:dephospho-CoA kinase